MGIIDWIKDKIKKDKPKPTPSPSTGFFPVPGGQSKRDPIKEIIDRGSSSGGGSSGGGSSSRDSGMSIDPGKAGGGSSSSSRTPTPTTDFEKQLEEQVKAKQTEEKRAFQEQIEKQRQLKLEEQQRSQELIRQREFLDRQREAMRNQSVSEEEFKKFAKKYADINKKINSQQTMTGGGDILQVGLPTGKEALTQRWSSRDNFSDLIYDSSYGQGTEIKKDKFFAGYTEEGKPEFVTAPTGMTTLGELQLEREARKFGAEEKIKNIEKDFQNKIQQEYNKDINNYANRQKETFQKLVNEGKIEVSQANKLLNEDIKNYGESVLNTKKYKDIENKAISDIKKINLPKDIQGLYEQSLKTKKQKIIENIPLIGSGKAALESSRKYAELASNISAVGGKVYKPIGIEKAGRKALSDIGLFALDFSLVSGLGKAGINISRAAIRREIAKRGSIGLEKLGKAKISGINFIEEGGKFYMVGKQRAGNFIRNFKLEGNLIKQGKGYSFIPRGEGKSVVVGISEAKLKGIGGKTKQLIGKISGEPTKELFVMPQTFEIGGAGVSRRVPYSLRGLELSRGSGIGVYTPIAQSSARFTKKTTKSLSQQIAENIKRGGDPIVSQMISPQFSGSFRGRKVGLELSKQREILNLLYEKPKKLRIERQFTKIARGTPRETIKKKAYNFADDLVKIEKPKVFKEPPKTSGRTQTQLLYDKPKSKPTTDQFQFTETLQKGFQSQKYPTLPFQFADISTSRVSSVFGALFGASTALGGLSRNATRKAQESLSRTKTGTSSLTRSLTSQKQISRQVTKPTKKVTGTDVIVQGLTGGVGGGGVFGGIRPFGRIRPPRISRPMTSIKKTKRPVKRKKKRKFKLEITGFQSVTGIKRPTKRKKISQITGFELLR